MSIWRHGNSESLIPESFMQRKQIVRGDFHFKNTSVDTVCTFVFSL
jgi:hypothetical protein